MADLFHMLTEEERAIVRDHPRRGHEALAKQGGTTIEGEFERKE